MQEFTVTLKEPGKEPFTETVHNRETAYGMKERWEKRGEGYTAEVAEGSLAIATKAA